MRKIILPVLAAAILAVAGAPAFAGTYETRGIYDPACVMAADLKMPDLRLDIPGPQLVAQHRLQSSCLTQTF